MSQAARSTAKQDRMAAGGSWLDCAGRPIRPGVTWAVEMSDGVVSRLAALGRRPSAYVALRTSAAAGDLERTVEVERRSGVRLVAVPRYLERLQREIYARASPAPRGTPVTEPRAGACCRRAVRVPCVCRGGWECPVHGWRHVGTHD